jgi:hypothetical protein
VVSSRSPNVLNLIWSNRGDLKDFVKKVIHNFFHMNSNENKFYIKIVALEVIHNFVVEKFLN